MSLSKRCELLLSALLLAFGAMPIMAEPENVPTEHFDAADGRLPAGWRVQQGDWRAADGQLYVDALDGEARITFGKPDWRDYEIQATVTFDKVRDDSRWAAIVFRADPSGGMPYSQFPIRFKCDRSGGVEFAVRLDSRQWSVRGVGKVAEDCRLGRPRKLRVVVRGANVEGYIDGRLEVDSAYCLDRSAGLVGLAASGCAARFDDVSVRLLPPSPVPAEKELQPCEVVGHRGFSAVAPENTLASAIKAIESGATGSECDVYAAKDGTLVLMHDETVDRTTNGRGKVTELTLAEITKLDAGSWKDPKYAGESVPTLAEVLARQKDSGCIPVVEIKMEGIAGKVVEAIRAAGMIDQAAVISFSAEVVKDVRSIEPRLPCAWLCGKELTGTPSQRAEWIAEQARACGTNLVDLNYQMLSEEVIAELKKRGMTVWTWTVDDPVVMEALMRWGVASITTDRPDLAVELQRRAAGRDRQKQ
jgi:glycerophosphoryl diester phosphodiesterase